MNYGDIYKHYKGGEYIFNCIATPLNETYIYSMDDSTSTKIATHTETGQKIRIFDFLGAQVADSEEPLVIYQSTKEFHQLNYWARPVDMFFGVQELEDGKMVQRFVKTK